MQALACALEWQLACVLACESACAWARQFSCDSACVSGHVWGRVYGAVLGFLWAFATGCVWGYVWGCVWSVVSARWLGQGSACGSVRVLGSSLAQAFAELARALERARSAVHAVLSNVYSARHHCMQKP